MMSIHEIRSFYPEFLHGRGEFLLREYLQYKILEIIFSSRYANQFSFLGGTCLRIVHGSQRFSEDLDFDNFDLSESDFKLMSEEIRASLEAQGFMVEIRPVIAGAFHCYIRFPELLYKTGLSGHKEAKILINLDTEPQGFEFVPEQQFLNKFDVFTSIRTTPIDMLLSQKFLAMTQRRRPKGRDFYDAVFLLARTKPNYSFLENRLDISTPEALRAHLKILCERMDFKALAADVQAFLFNPTDARMVLEFPRYLETAAL
jgi:predicted nucleotidyltransferase component of viral defense system